MFVVFSHLYIHHPPLPSPALRYSLPVLLFPTFMHPIPIDICIFVPSSSYISRSCHHTLSPPSIRTAHDYPYPPPSHQHRPRHPTLIPLPHALSHDHLYLPGPVTLPHPTSLIPCILLFLPTYPDPGISVPHGSTQLHHHRSSVYIAPRYRALIFGYPRLHSTPHRGYTSWGNKDYCVRNCKCRYCSPLKMSMDKIL